MIQSIAQNFLIQVVNVSFKLVILHLHYFIIYPLIMQFIMKVLLG